MTTLRMPLSLALSLALFASSCPVLAAPQDPMTSTGRQLYEAGIAAYQQEHWEECYAKLIASWATFHHYQIAGLLGLCESKIGHVRDAAEHLEYAIGHDDHVDAVSTAMYKNGLEEVTKRVAAVKVIVNLEGAEVRIDGKALDKVPPDTVYLDPGFHEFEARHEGFVAATTRRELEAGSRINVRLDLSKIAPSSDPPAPPTTHLAASTPTIQTSGDRPSAVPAIVGGSVGLIGLGVGIGLLAASGSQGASADALSASLLTEGAGCKPPVGTAFVSACAELSSRRRSYDSLHDAGSILTGTSAAVLAGSVVYLIWRSSRAVITASPTVGAGFEGLSLAGSF